MSGFLALEDGTVIRGDSVAASGFAVGEAVFTTAMTGYQEVVTDPSFAEQLVCFTAPMVGNYGVADGRSESSAVHARAVIMREARGPAWTDWLHERGVVALSGIDTRSLVLKLRSAGAMRAVAVTGDSSVAQAVDVARRHPPMAGRPLARDVGTRRPYVYADVGRVRLAVVDYGCKRSILRRLVAAGAAVTVFPNDVDSSELLRYDGVVPRELVRRRGRRDDRHGRTGLREPPDDRPLAPEVDDGYAEAAGRRDGVRLPARD